jgi:hypothetical protein
MIKSLRQYRAVPVNSLLDDDEPQPQQNHVEVGSLLDDSAPSKKKEEPHISLAPTESSKQQLPYLYNSSNGAIYGTMPSSSEAPSSSIDPKDPVKSLLFPAREKYQKAQLDYAPIRNMAVSDATTNNVLPTEVVNQRASEVNNKRIAEKDSLIELNATHDAIKKHLDNVKVARSVIDKVKSQNGGVVPKDNETAQAAQESLSEYNRLTNDIISSKGVVGAAIKEELQNNKDFANQYKILGGKIPKSYEGKLVMSYVARHGDNIQNFIEEHPEYGNQIKQVTNDFAKNYPETVAAQIGNEVSQEYEKRSRKFADFNTETFNQDVDNLASEMYKDNPQKLDLYNKLVKDNKKDYFRSAAALNSFGGSALTGLNETMNSIRTLFGSRDSKERAYDALDKEGKFVAANPKGIREWISEGSGFAGLIAEMGAGGNVAKGLGASNFTSQVAPVVTNFYDQQLKDSEGRFGEGWRAKLSAGLKTTAFAIAPNAFPTKVFGNAIDNALKDVSEKASVSSVRARAINATVGAIKQYGKGIGEMTAIKQAEQIVDAALGKPHEGADNELYQTAKSMAMGNVLPALIHGGGQYLGTKVEKPMAKGEEPTPPPMEATPESKVSVVMPNEISRPQIITIAPKEQAVTPEQGKGAKIIMPETNRKPVIVDTKTKSDLRTAIDELPENTYTSVLKTADEKQLPEYLKNIAEQLNSSESEANTTRKVFGDKLSDLALKLYPDARPEPINIPTELRGTEEGNKKNEPEGVGEVDNGLQVDNRGSGEGIGDKTIDVDNRGTKEEPLPISESTNENRKDWTKGDYVVKLDKLRSDKKADAKKITDGKEVLTTDEQKELDESNKFYDDKIKEYHDEFQSRLPDESSNTLSGIKENKTDEAIPDKVQNEETSSNESPQVADKQQEPPIEPPKEKEPVKEGEDGSVGIRHEDTAGIRQQYGLGDYEKIPETFEKWDKEAAERIDKGEMPNVIKKLEAKDPIDPVEQRMMGKYIATLKAAFDNNQSDENFSALKKAVELSDAIGGSEVGKSLVARKGTFLPEDSLAAFMLKEAETNHVETLTDAQKEKVKQEHEQIQKKQSDFDEYVKKKEAELSDREAKLSIEEEKKASRTSSKAKKSHDDYVKERQDAVAKAKEALKKIRTGESGLSAVPLPGVRELMAIAPHVKDVMKSYVSEGIGKLEDIIDRLHDDFKDTVDGLTKEHIRDIIAGAYNKKLPEKKDLAKQVFELGREAKWLKKLEEAYNAPEKTEKQKVEKNQRIAEIKKQIKGIKAIEAEKNAPQKAIESAKKKIQKQLDEVNEQLRTGNFEKKPPKPKVQLDEQGKKLLNALVKARQQRDIRLMQIQYAQRSRYQKAVDAVLEVLNVPRTIMSSTDFSAPLRQGLFAFVSHPVTGIRATKEMFNFAFSQQRFDNWFHQLKDSPRYDLMMNSELSLSDPHDYRLTAKEEAFMNNLAEKIPLIGKTLIKGSERAYVGFLNKMRVDLFNRYADYFEEQGRTYDNSPELYKALGKYIGDATGRGSMGKIEAYAPVFNSVLFSPRLIASRLNLMSNWANPHWYKETPKPLRIMYFKDMAKFIGFGLSILTLAKLGGADVEDDPRSSDFGKIRSGNTRWDIWGGFQQYARLFTQIATGEKKSATSNIVSPITGQGRFGETRGDVIERFFRGKLAPVPSMVWDFAKGRTVTGDKTDSGDDELNVGSTQPFNFPYGKEVENHFLPLIFSDMKEAMRDKGVSSIFTVGIPATFGVGIQTFNPKPPSNTGGGAGAKGNFNKSAKSPHKSKAK